METAVEEENIGSSFGLITLSPQPTTANTTLTFTMENPVNMNVRIINLFGVEVLPPIQYQTQIGINILHLPTDGLPNGAYISAETKIIVAVNIHNLASN